MRHLLTAVRRLLAGKGKDEGVRTDGGTVEESSGLRDRLDSDLVESSPFWLPPFLLMGFFVYGAIAWNALISLTDHSGFGPIDYSSLDFEMYVRAFNDSQFVFAARNTVVLIVGFIVVCLVIGLLLAILLDRQIRFKNGFRTIYLLPMSLSFVVTAQFWLWLYNVDDGIVNSVLGVVGLGPYSWIGDPQLVLGAVAFALVWQFSGYTMVVYLATLQSIPDEHYEAARVDGASTVKMYWRVIIPQLRNAMVSATVVLMVFALKAFDFLYALVGGYRPPKGADILPTLMVRTAYSRNEFAYGSTIAILLFLLALSIVAPYLYHQYKHGNL